RRGRRGTRRPRHPHSPPPQPAEPTHRRTVVKNHSVRVHPSSDNLAREDQLAWKIAEVASEPVGVTDEVADMVINRIIDNASVAAASLSREPVVAARAQALAAAPLPELVEGRPSTSSGNGRLGSTVFGVPNRVSPEWA